MTNNTRQADAATKTSSAHAISTFAPITEFNSVLCLDGVMRPQGDLDAAPVSFAEGNSQGHDCDADSHTVYNFTVARTHTYIAGGVRVHNTSVWDFYDPEIDGYEITELPKDTDGDGLADYMRVVKDGKVTEIFTEAVDASGTTRVLRDITVRRKDGEFVHLEEIETRDGNKDTIEEKILYGRGAGEAVAKSLTPFITTALAGDDNVFTQIATETVLDTVMGNLGEFVGVNLHKSIVGSLDRDEVKLFTEVFDDFGVELGLNLADNTVSVVNRLIMAELFGSIDLDGIPNSILQGLVGGGVNTITSQGMDVFLDTVFPKSDVSKLFEPSSFNLNTVTNIVVGAVLSEILPEAETLEGQIASAVTNAGFGYIMSANASALATFGSVAGPAAIVLGFAALVGQIVDEIFGGEPQAESSSTYRNGEFVTVQRWTDDDGDEAVSDAMADAFGQVVNNVLTSIDGVISDADIQSHYFQYEGDTFKQTDNTERWFGPGARHDNATDAVHRALLDRLKTFEVHGGNMVVERAFETALNEHVLRYFKSRLDDANLWDGKQAAALLTSIGRKDLFTHHQRWEPDTSTDGELRDRYVESFEFRVRRDSKENFVEDIGWYVSGRGERVSRALSDDLPSGDQGDVRIQDLATSIGSAMAIAADYQKYLDNTETVNTIIELADGSGIAAGWTATLLAAADGGLGEGYNERGSNADETFRAADGNDSISAGAGADTVYSYGGDDAIYGQGGDDTLYGGAGDDSLFGNSGNDILNVGTGSGSWQTMDGGSGDDRYELNSSSGSVSIGPVAEKNGGGFDVISFGDLHLGDLDINRSFSPEGREVVEFAWGMTNDREAGRLVLEGVRNHFERYEFAEGFTIELAGREAMLDHAKGDNPLVIDGTDLDILVRNMTSTRISGGSGHDWIVGGSVSDNISGGDGNDRLGGGAGTDTIHGGRGNDILEGGSGADALYGGAGDDIFWGVTSSDTVHGGDGIDTAIVFGVTAEYASYRIVRIDGKMFLGHPTEGLIELGDDIERISFEDGLTFNIDGLRDTNWLEYIASHGDLIEQVGDRGVTLNVGSAFGWGESHYRDYGWKEGRTVTFDGLAYNAGSKELIDRFGSDKVAGTSNYITWGYYEKADTGFDTHAYIAANPDLIDVIGTNIDAITLHYIQYGHGEDRVKGVENFDPLRYIASNLDLMLQFGGTSMEEAKVLASAHYGIHNIRNSEGRSADSFDVVAYLAENPELQSLFYGSNEGLSWDRVTWHYIHEAFKAGREAGIAGTVNIANDGNGWIAADAAFDPLLYVASHGDLIERYSGLSKGTLRDLGLKHYRDHGKEEGRDVTFDPFAYATKYKDIYAAFGEDPSSAALHYIQHGYAEGRSAPRAASYEQPTGLTTKVVLTLAGEVSDGLAKAGLFVNGIRVGTVDVGNRTWREGFQDYSFDVPTSLFGRGDATVEVRFLNPHPGRHLHTDAITVDGTKYDVSSPNGGAYLTAYNTRSVASVVVDGSDVVPTEDGGTEGSGFGDGAETEIVLRLANTGENGHADARVSIDGVHVGTVQVTNLHWRDGFADYSLKVASDLLGGGSHNVEVQFSNPAPGRGLQTDAITIAGQLLDVVGTSGGEFHTAYNSRTVASVTYDVGSASGGNAVNSENDADARMVPIVLSLAANVASDGVPAVAVLEIDGTQVATFDVSNRTWPEGFKDYTVDVDATLLEFRDHRIEVLFENPAGGRGLHTDAITVDGNRYEIDGANGAEHLTAYNGRTPASVTVQPIDGPRTSNDNDGNNAGTGSGQTGGADDGTLVLSLAANIAADGVPIDALVFVKGTQVATVTVSNQTWREGFQDYVVEVDPGLLVGNGTEIEILFGNPAGGRGLHIDAITANAVRYDVTGSNGAEYLTAYNGRTPARIETGSGDRKAVVSGTDGNDTLSGENNFGEWIVGGAGDDVMYGGTGADVFVFSLDPGSYDTIKDYEIGRDRIELVGQAFTDVGGTNGADGALVTLARYGQSQSVLFEGLRWDEIDQDLVL